MKPITSGQKEQGVTVIKDAARKGGEEAITELGKNGTIDFDGLQRVLGWKGLAPAIQAIVKEKTKELVAAFVENISGIVKLISGAETLELDKTDGKATIAKAKDTFPGYIDGNFEGWGCDVKSEPTGKTRVSVHEMVKDGTFAQIFGGMSDDLNSLCLTQPQIIHFVEKHKKWLRTDGYGTFFLFKVGEELFVADVGFGGYGRLEVSVLRFSYGNVWHAEYGHRVVVPQLALAN
jgi:hypothetical protein